MLQTTQNVLENSIKEISSAREEVISTQEHAKYVIMENIVEEVLLQVLASLDTIVKTRQVQSLFPILQISFVNSTIGVLKEQVFLVMLYLVELDFSVQTKEERQLKIALNVNLDIFVTHLLNHVLLVKFVLMVMLRI